jgi:hypothetical protein
MILSDCLSIALSHIASISNSMHDLKVEETMAKLKELQSKESKSVEEEKLIEEHSNNLKFAVSLSNTLTILNDAMHPAHEIALTLFDEDKHAMIKWCILNQSKAIASKMITDDCKCYTCKAKGIK